MTTLLRCDRCAREAAKLSSVDGSIVNPERDREGVADGGTVNNSADLCGRCYRTVWLFIFKRPPVRTKR